MAIGKAIRLVDEEHLSQRLLELVPCFGCGLPNILSDEVSGGSLKDFGGREEAHVVKNLADLLRSSRFARAFVPVRMVA